MIRNKMSRAEYMRRPKIKKLSKKQREGFWKGYAKRTKQAVKPRRKARTFGKGKFKAVQARIGPKSRPTFMYRTKGGNARHIPEWGVLGYASFKDMIAKSSTRKGARVYVARKERLDARRERAAEKTGSRILKGRGIFTPNPRRRRPSATFTYEEWEKEMKSNASRRKKATKKKKRSTKKRPTAAQTRARKRNLKKAQASRRKKVTRRRKKTTKRRTVKRTAAKRRPTKRRATKRRTTAKRRPAKRRTAKRTARRNPRRRFFRNQVKSFKSDFAKVLKVGLSVGAGFVVQKVATKLLTGTGLIDSIPGVQQFKGSVAGLAVALLGTLGAAKFIPGDAKMVGAGMGAGFLHTLLIDGLNAFDQPQLVEYLGNYTETEGKAFGSYYEFQRHQKFPAVGEYYSLPSGMGQYEQAAAGMGQYEQAAAGMGQAPQLTQAAAGTGEYLVAGGQGIGEYEEVVPQYSAPEQIQEGISPDLDSAEQALNVSEAAAGIGAYGDERVPLQSTVYPTGNPEAIPDMPGGSRAGTFAGSNGVFGTSH
ncbi:MAG: hypothetical protein JRD89_02360 [Deltaproteobacteria bacterium]|nr:hypothetical protein [Deltaproteobacteria bacterium]